MIKIKNCIFNLNARMFSKNTKSILNIIRHYSKIPELTKVTFQNGIKTITMCNEKTRNSLSVAMMENLVANIKTDENDDNLRVIVLDAEGPVFSAGHNLKELSLDNNGKEHIENVFRVANHLMSCIIDCPVPIVAKVNGVAAAAGCQLVAQCDIAICTENSKFSTPGATFGIFCSTPGIALARSVNKMTAMHMLLTGLPLSGEEAERAALVTKACAPDELNQEVKKICQAIKSKSRSVIELGKKFYYKQIKLDVKEAYHLGGRQMVDNLLLQDGQEGIRSFTEKRAPKWTHKKN